MPGPMMIPFPGVTRSASSAARARPAKSDAEPTTPPPRRRSANWRLERLVACAALAPSTRNTQPWRFVEVVDGLHMYVDRSRLLRSVDERGREMIMSCGVALFYLQLAARHYGEAIVVRVKPFPGEPDLLATITLRDEEPIRQPDHAADALFGAIRYRHTQRRHFDRDAVPPMVRDRLRDAASDEGALLFDLGSTSLRETIARLVEAGDRAQGGSSFARREIAAWTMSLDDWRNDGIPATALGMPLWMARYGSAILSRFPWGRLQAFRDARLARRAPLLLAISTERDDERAWIDAGRALGRVLLTGAVHGLSASFLNQPIQIAELRWRLRDELTTDLFPQVILRMGYGPVAPPTPRRAVEELLTPPA